MIEFNKRLTLIMDENIFNAMLFINYVQIPESLYLCVHKKNAPIAIITLAIITVVTQIRKSFSKKRLCVVSTVANQQLCVSGVKKRD